jgi:putative ABC transport system permease protein
MFSIINTMLMAVLERVREIGMLMAIGMVKQKVFGMIMLETVFLSMIGGPLGLFISWLLISYFGEVGIDLSAANYEDFGFSTMIYPELPISSYVNVTILVVIMSVLSAIYPAIKALKLNPVEAIRKI